MAAGNKARGRGRSRSAPISGPTTGQVSRRAITELGRPEAKGRLNSLHPGAPVAAAAAPSLRILPRWSRGWDPFSGRAASGEAELESQLPEFLTYLDDPNNRICL